MKRFLNFRTLLVVVLVCAIGYVLHGDSIKKALSDVGV